MRTFILFSRKAVTSPKFYLDDLSGSGGKMDTVCRFVTAALWASHSLRRDTNVFVVLNGPPNPPVTIEFSGKSLKRVNPDERSIACWIKKALKDPEKEWTNIQDGIKVARLSFQDIIKMHKDRPIYVLEEKGKKVQDVGIKKDPVFVIGDSVGMPKNDEKFALRYGEKISIGDKAYFASACCTIINWLMD